MPLDGPPEQVNRPTSVQSPTGNVRPLNAEMRDARGCQCSSSWPHQKREHPRHQTHFRSSIRAITQNTLLVNQHTGLLAINVTCLFRRLSDS
jgi:hypothetical protein